MIDQSWVEQFASRLLKKKVLLQVLIIWQKHTVNNYPTKLRLKVIFLDWWKWCGWFKIVVQINVCISSNPQTLGALSWNRWWTLSGPHTPLLLVPPYSQILDPPLDMHIYFWLKGNFLALIHLRVLLLNKYEISSISEYPVWR